MALKGEHDARTEVCDEVDGAGAGECRIKAFRLVEIRIARLHTSRQALGGEGSRGSGEGKHGEASRGQVACDRGSLLARGAKHSYGLEGHGGGGQKSEERAGERVEATPMPSDRRAFWGEQSSRHAPHPPRPPRLSFRELHVA